MRGGAGDHDGAEGGGDTGHARCGPPHEATTREKRWKRNAKRGKDEGKDAALAIADGNGRMERRVSAGECGGTDVSTRRVHGQPPPR